MFRNQVDIALTTDLIKDEVVDFVRKLRACVKWQTPKWQGKVYVAARHSPVELLTMVFKSHFQLPTFVLASLNPESVLTWSASDNYNVVFEIDISSFPSYSTIVPDNKCLLTCYNNYRWTGYKLVNATVDGQQVAVPLVSLSVEGTYNYSEYGGEGHPVRRVPLDWTRKDASAWDLTVSPAALNEKFRELTETFDKTCDDEHKLIWLNATFDGVHGDALVQDGIELDGKAYFDFTKVQEVKDRLTI